MTVTDDSEDIVDSGEAVRILGTYRVDVIRAAHSGALRAYRRGRRGGPPWLFRRADVLDYARRVNRAVIACRAAGLTPPRREIRVLDAYEAPQ